MTEQALHRVLIELRPALEGHAGVPQETRLLFAGLSDWSQRLPASSFAVEALLQAGVCVLPGQRCPSPQAVFRALDQPLNRLALARATYQAALAAWHDRLLPLGSTSFASEPDRWWARVFERSLPGPARSAAVGVPCRVLPWPRVAMHGAGLAASWFRRHACAYPRVDTQGAALLLTQTPFPGRVGPGSRLVVRYHDSFPMTHTATVKHGRVHAALFAAALRQNVADGAWFACVSGATRDGLLAVYPELAERTVVLPNMVSAGYHTAASEAELHGADTTLWPLVGGGGQRIPDYLLMVATLEPRKDHAVLLQAWQRLRARWPALRLVLVGGEGWQQTDLRGALRRAEAAGGLHWLQRVSTPSLRLLYQHARVVVAPSRAEGFDFPGVEAMACGAPVVASDIPVHHEVFGHAWRAFPVGDAVALADTLVPMLDMSEAPRSLAGGRNALASELVQASLSWVSRYRPETVLPQWVAFLERLLHNVEPVRGPH